jgi:hypothetical protein
VKHPVLFLAMTGFFGLSFGSPKPASANACEQQELQFFGTIRNVQLITGPYATLCSYQIEIAAYPEARPSEVCPLSEEKSSGLTLFDLNCRIKEGTAVSGVLVHKLGQTWIE